MRLLFVAFCVCQAFGPTFGRLVRDIPSLKAELGHTPPATTTEFDLTAKVVFACTPQNKAFNVTDGTNIIMLVDEANWPRVTFTEGDILHVRGRIQAKGNPDCLAIDVVGKSQSEPIPDVSIIDIRQGVCEMRRVRLRGTVRNAFVDEIDPEWAFITIYDRETALLIEFMPSPEDARAMQSIVNAEVCVTGLALRPRFVQKCNRRFSPATLAIHSLADIQILRPAPDDPFCAPALEDSNPFLTPDCQNQRRSVCGHVLAAYEGNRLLLRTEQDRIINIELSSHESPAIGERVKVVGYPATDLYRVNLTDALWRKMTPNGFVPNPPEDIDLKELLTDGQGNRMIKPIYHGRTIRICGIVRTLPTAGQEDKRLCLECDSFIFPVDATGCPQALKGLTTGCLVEVTGTCVMPTSNWHPNMPLPRIRDVFLALRTSADLQILRTPSAWTPRRLLLVITSLFIGLAAVFLWNRRLKRRIEQRSRELLDEQIAHVTSELKTVERTHLAIELHDSLAQNLASVALQLQAARELIQEDVKQASHHLETANQSLLSCREELRNCLRDLRAEVIDEDSVDKAIRTTLAPCHGDANIAIRFNVPRTEISDTSLHNVLRIIRELVFNAVRHGRAHAIKVAGVREGSRLLFSVSDNGCGFNPNNRPGPREGHFGLQGIHERIKRLGGEVKIVSAAGRGTKVSLSIKLP